MAEDIIGTVVSFLNAKMSSNITSVIQIVQSAMVRTRLSVARPAPSLFFFPGLNSRPVYPPNTFQFEAALRENIEVIRSEYLNLRKNTKLKSDYEDSTEHKLHHGDWEWNSYVQKGKRNADFAVKCPKTVELLESFENPALMTSTPFSFAFFSTMGPQANILSHFGPCNLRLRCHVPIIVPDGDCALQVGNEIIRWEEGKPIVFDDSYEHQGLRHRLY